MKIRFNFNFEFIKKVKSLPIYLKIKKKIVESIERDKLRKLGSKDNITSNNVINVNQVIALLIVIIVIVAAAIPVLSTVLDSTGINMTEISPILIVLITLFLALATLVASAMIMM